ncbi:hypothetical protein M3Y95_01173200 [Aphelenchoides besseyi]|nr:hypothetical protein M3Y95_01173200 [Aphelenchoides besseyi]
MESGGGSSSNENCRQISIKHNFLVQTQKTIRTRRRKEVKKETLPTGCVVEELEDKLEERARCFYARQHFQNCGNEENLHPTLMPVLLRASKRLRAVDFVVPPTQDDEMHQIRSLYRQAMHVPAIFLTTNEEVPVNIVHYEVSNLRYFASQVFITSSPVYTLHWEVCPPVEKVEKFKNPRLQCVSDVLHKPAKQKKAEVLKPHWMHTKLTTAYGVHKAVQRVIVTERIEKVKRLKARKEVTSLCQQKDYIPIAKTYELQTIRLPTKHVLRLCAINETKEEAKRVQEVEVGDEFYDAVDSYEISIEHTHTIDAHFCYKNQEK